MPSLYLEKISKEYDKSIKELEKFWKEAKKAAKEAGKSDTDYAYITAIFKKMAGIEESEQKTESEFPTTFKQFLVDHVEDLC